MGGWVQPYFFLMPIISIPSFSTFILVPALCLCCGIQLSLTFPLPSSTVQKALLRTHPCLQLLLQLRFTSFFLIHNF
ncbi:hypothetical protein BDW72DRAFT_178223 [Aspergillus terricola var. indicus]